MKMLRHAFAWLVAIAATSTHAQGIDGEWATQGYSARVRIAPCFNNLNHTCGTITWLWEPVDASGAAPTDQQNPDHKLRHRPLIGLPLLQGFRPRDAQRWSDGTIYDPESGRTYKASMTLKSAEVLEVEGCVLFVCKKQVWRRVESVCAKS